MRVKLLNNVTLVTGRSLKQGVGLELGKTSEDYFNSVNYVEVNPKDAARFGLKDGAPVSLSTNHGEVILNWRVHEGLPQGLAFVPYGIWANQVLGCDTRCTGTPHFKGVKARINSAEEKHVSNLSEIVAALKEGVK